MKIKLWSDKHPLLSFLFWWFAIGFIVAGWVQLNIWLGVG